VKEGGEEKGSVRESVYWGCYYDKALDIEVDLQRGRFGCRESDLALQRLVECHSLETVRVVTLRAWFGVCVYYCSTYHKTVRVGGGGEWRTCGTRDDEPRPVWTRLPITH
jgi:hypothetical protein